MTCFQDCLRLDPDDRPTCSQLLKHEFFTRDGFAQKFSHDLKAKLTKEQEKNALLNSIVHDDDKEGADSNKTTTKKKKKLPLVKKDTKTDTDHNKSLSKEGNKASTKDTVRITPFFMLLFFHAKLRNKVLVYSLPIFYGWSRFLSLNQIAWNLCKFVMLVRYLN